MIKFYKRAYSCKGLSIDEDSKVGTMKDDFIPVIVGVGQITEKDVDPAEAMSPAELLLASSERALEDAKILRKKLSELDLLVVVKSIADALPVTEDDNVVKNSPQALSEALGAFNAKKYISATGGCSPQSLVIYAARQIAEGNMRFALFSGAEALSTINRAYRRGIDLPWNIPSERTPEMIFPDPAPGIEIEKAHDLFLPSHVYPVFENALRRHYGKTIEEHQEYLGRLMGPFTEVAAQNPYAWFKSERKPEEISNAYTGNRYIAFPYTKMMNSMINVNQSAALVVTSARFAHEMGVDESGWIYIHGFSEATDHWHISDRVNYHSSPAISKISRHAMKMAGITIDEIDFFDLYSCFPSAIEITRDMLGIAKDDPRSLTVTGGLPYFGGPGNNYVMHSIAAMAEKLRHNPGKKGLVTGNTWYLSKHNIGIYSSEPAPSHEVFENQASCFKNQLFGQEKIQAEINAEPHPEVVNYPSGRGDIETYTVVYKRDGTPSKGIVIGRLGDDRRYIANVPDDPALLQNMTQADPIGISGVVRQKDNLNIFLPD